MRASAAFVLYKLDATIEHLLVDEAQDTNSEYWAILRASRRSSPPDAARADRRLRTVFAVGDEKQSIYGFQGAEPKIFGVMRERLRRGLSRRSPRRPGASSIARMTLNVSFRSTQRRARRGRRGLRREGALRGAHLRRRAAARHVSTRRGEPGAVDLWPVLAGDESAEVDPFGLPELGALPASAEVKLARRIAAEIKR